MSPTSHLPLFGGPRAWSQDDWVASDDRVRGGASQSELTCSASSLIAKFHGTLDIKTLGGAGFASQRTRGDDRKWDLSRYDGIELVVDSSDGKMYTLTLKDEILPKRPDGREQSTISWEYDFRAQGHQTIFIKWSDFRATYRGREKGDAEPLDLKNIKRFSIMIRSFFGDQEGAFALNLVSIAALRTERYLDEPDDQSVDEVFYEKSKEESAQSSGPERRQGWLGWLTSCLL